MLVSLNNKNQDEEAASCLNTEAGGRSQRYVVGYSKVNSAEQAFVSDLWSPRNWEVEEKDTKTQNSVFTTVDLIRSYHAGLNLHAWLSSMRNASHLCTTWQFILSNISLIFMWFCFTKKVNTTKISRWMGIEKSPLIRGGQSRLQ